MVSRSVGTVTVSNSATLRNRSGVIVWTSRRVRLTASRAAARLSIDSALGARTAWCAACKIDNVGGSDRTSSSAFCWHGLHAECVIRYQQYHGVSTFLPLCAADTRTINRSGSFSVNFTDGVPFVAGLKLSVAALNGLVNVTAQFTQILLPAGATLTSGSSTTYPTTTRRLADVALDFGASNGLWLVTNPVASTPQWSKLHGLNPTRMAMGDVDGSGAADLIVDFPGYGVWIWSNNASWIQLHPSDVTDIAVGDLDGNGRADVMLSFPATASTLG